MPNVELLRKYARLAVRIGANVQKGQPLLINTNLELKDFVRICVEEGYKAGASIVSVRYNDEINNHLAFEYQCCRF
ncbi:MAG: aminopeptidase [Erysipelotrichaceae bacterium]